MKHIKTMCRDRSAETVGLLFGLIAVMAVALSLGIGSATADDNPLGAGPAGVGLRGLAPLSDNADAPRVARTEETDRRRPRAYPEQPPTIPHKIDGYQLDKNGNQCLSCHARTRVDESGAPMISVTHFQDRDGQSLATVSPRRYFCNQCHVVQNRVPEAMENTFVDVDSLLAVEATRASE